MTETDPSATRLARQELWRKRLAEAESRYHESAIWLQSLAGAGPARERARANKAAARAEYLRILRVFSDFVVRDIEPAEESDAGMTTPSGCGVHKKGA